MALEWLGPAVTKRLARAQIQGVNATLAAAVNHAKRNHDWQNRTGTLEGSIGVQDFARAEGRGVRGNWGSRDARYALIHELGGVIVPKKAKALVFEIGGEVVRVMKVVIPARPYLRPAADATYPGLAGRIRRAYAGGGRS